MTISRPKLLGLIFFVLTFVLAGLLFFFLKSLILDFQPSASPSPIAEKPVQLILVGDIMLDRGVAWQIEKNNADYSFPFLKIAEELKKADLVFGNLESQISDQGQKVGSIYSFRAKPEARAGLKSAHFQILSLANNHALDYGRQALTDSLNRLLDGQLSPVGAGLESQAFAPVIKNIRGTKVTFFAYADLGSASWLAKAETPGIAQINEGNLEKIKADIKLAKTLTDFIIVTIHWGDEYAEKANARQILLAHAFVDAGADLVVGSHPHVMQNQEAYQGKLIFYSLGNFVFDQSFSESTMQGGLLRVSIQGKKLLKAVLEKIKINGSFQPELAE